MKGGWRPIGNLAKPGSVDIAMKSQAVNILVLCSVTAPQLCHKSTKAVTANSSMSGCGCALTLFMDLDIWISFDFHVWQNISFLLIFFFTFIIQKCKNHSWFPDHRKTGSGLELAHGMEFADLWATVSEKRGWWCGVVFKGLLAGDSLTKSDIWSRSSATALVEEQRAWRLLLSLLLPLPPATSGSRPAVEIRLT